MNDRHLTITESEDRWHVRRGKRASKPALQLRGAWLARAGFPAGSRVRVVVRRGELVIRPEVRALSETKGKE